MIKSSELRTGNYVREKKTGTIYKIGCVTGHLVTLYRRDDTPFVDKEVGIICIKYLEPLPLSPDILRANRFHIETKRHIATYRTSMMFNNERIYKDNVYIDLLAPDLSFVIITTADKVGGYTMGVHTNEFKGRIDSVHRLQNILELCKSKKQIKIK